MRLFGSALTALTVVVLWQIYNASLDNIATLSPQGCRMSWMNPSYILQPAFDETWTTLSKRYTLWLYREEGWDMAGQVRHVHIHLPLFWLTLMT